MDLKDVELTYKGNDLDMLVYQKYYRTKMCPNDKNCINVDECYCAHDYKEIRNVSEPCMQATLTGNCSGLNGCKCNFVWLPKPLEDKLNFHKISFDLSDIVDFSLDANEIEDSLVANKSKKRKFDDDIIFESEIKHEMQIINLEKEYKNKLVALELAYKLEISNLKDNNKRLKTQHENQINLNLNLNKENDKLRKEKRMIELDNDALRNYCNTAYNKNVRLNDEILKHRHYYEMSQKSFLDIKNKESILNSYIKKNILEVMNNYKNKILLLHNKLSKYDSYLKDFLYSHLMTALFNQPIPDNLRQSLLSHATKVIKELVDNGPLPNSSNTPNPQTISNERVPLSNVHDANLRNMINRITNLLNNDLNKVNDLFQNNDFNKVNDLFKKN